MKKLLCPILLLLALLAFCGWSTWRVDALCRQSAQYLQQAETRCRLGDYDGAKDLVYAAKHSWDKHEGFLGTALRHTESDDIGVLFPPLLETCGQRDAEEFSRRNLELIALLKHLSRMEIPYYFNIL